MVRSCSIQKAFTAILMPLFFLGWGVVRGEDAVGFSDPPPLPKVQGLVSLDEADTPTRSERRENEDVDRPPVISSRTQDESPPVPQQKASEEGPSTTASSDSHGAVEETTSPGRSTEETFAWSVPMLGEVRQAPASNTDRCDRFIELLVRGGAAPDEICIERIKSTGNDEKNIFVRIEGTSAESGLILLGAHTDAMTGSPGVVDNWSGTVMLAALHAHLRQQPLRHTVMIAGFASEEHGGKGSSEYVAGLTDEERQQIRGMVNLDCLGVGAVRAWVNDGGKDLYQCLRKAAKDSGLLVDQRSLRGYTTDAASFERAGIPALTVHSLRVEDLLHINAPSDTAERISPVWYNRTFEILTYLLLRLDRGEMDTEEKPVTEEGFEPQVAEASEKLEDSDVDQQCQAEQDARKTSSSVKEQIRQRDKTESEAESQTPSAISGKAKALVSAVQAEGDYGLRIRGLATFSPESKSGIRNGDLLTHVNEMPVNSVTDLSRAMESSRTGNVVPMTVERREKHYILIVDVLVCY